MPLPRQASTASENQAPEAFLVVCLCAEWCTTCREYRSGFNELAAAFPESRFCWLDIEERADDLGDLDIEDFPTLFIERRALDSRAGGAVLFFGTMPPQLGHLRRMLETLSAQSLQESRDYALSAPERQAWQDDPDISRLGDLVA
jgi:thiol-disulfide isomerase/thioredoxin